MASSFQGWGSAWGDAWGVLSGIEPPAYSNIYYYNNGSWVQLSAPKIYDGSAWITLPSTVLTYDGTTWS